MPCGSWLARAGAGWRGATALTLPVNLSIVTLPPYSPELNPVENVWEYLRKNTLANRLYENYYQIGDACCQAWNDLMKAPKNHHIHNPKGLGPCIMSSGGWYYMIAAFKHWCIDNGLSPAPPMLPSTVARYVDSLSGKIRASTLGNPPGK